MTDIQRAARYLYIIKASFGADRKTFGTNKKNLINTIEYLPEIGKRLKDVVIENLDYQRLIRVYDRPKALFYLDPPYLGTEKYYDSGFKTDDHLRLSSTLHNIHGKFILSYNDSEYIREIYSEYKIEAISRNNNLAAKSNPSKFNEIIIKNY